MNRDIKDFIFFGSDKIADSALVALQAQGLEPRLIVRGRVDDETRGKITSLGTEYAILASYGKIVPQAVIDLFPKGIINIHPSMLPLLRGPSPIKSAILENFDKTGTSIMLLVKEMDAGPILIQEEISLSPREAHEPELRAALFDKGAELIARILPDYLAGKLRPTPQDESRATYTRKFTSEDTYINPTLLRGQTPTEEVQMAERKVRALFEEPGTYTKLSINTQNGTPKEIRVKILRAHIESVGGRDAESKLVPEMVQPEGKKPMDWQSFLRGNPLA